MGTFCSAITRWKRAEQQTVSCTSRSWEVSLGKYDNWCLFIVNEICSVEQRNSAPQSLWPAAPGSKNLKENQQSWIWDFNHRGFFSIQEFVSATSVCATLRVCEINLLYGMIINPEHSYSVYTTSSSYLLTVSLRLHADLTLSALLLKLYSTKLGSRGLNVQIFSFMLYTRVKQRTMQYLPQPLWLLAASPSCGERWN